VSGALPPRSPRQDRDPTALPAWQPFSLVLKAELPDCRALPGPYHFNIFQPPKCLLPGFCCLYDGSFQPLKHGWVELVKHWLAIKWPEHDLNPSNIARLTNKWMNKWMQLQSGEMGNWWKHQWNPLPSLTYLTSVPAQQSPSLWKLLRFFPQNEMVSSEWKSRSPERPACTKALRVTGSEASLLHGRKNGFHGKRGPSKSWRACSSPFFQQMW
jgi:hypothetical protein